MWIRVTQECIDEGVGSDPHWCPIACAIRARSEWGRVVVGWNRVSVDGEVFKLPWAAQTFVERFDGGGKSAVSPFEFELEGEA